MGLEPMPFGGGLPIISNGHGQEVKLDIRVFDTFLRADEGCTFKLVARANTRLGQQPLRPNELLLKTNSNA